MHKDKDWTKFIPTIMKNFIDKEIFTEEFLLKWDEEENEL